MWFAGENKHGCLGMPDNKNRVHPQILNFFWDKRIIDVACGKSFSVVVCESYDMTKEEKSKYFVSHEDRVKNVSLVRN